MYEIHEIDEISTEVNTSGFEFLQFDTKWVLYTDGVSGLYAWDSSDAAPYRVRDLVPYLPDNNMNPGVVLDATPFVPHARFLLKHRGRVFMADPLASKVLYSGTRMDFQIDEEDPEIDRPIRPWELWNIRMDLSRANPGYGGSMIVGDRAQNITGLMDVEGGLIVFKEREIILWTWPESAAPHEVHRGAYVTPIVSGVGLVDHKTIARDGEITYFLGRRGRNDIAVYRMYGNELQEISHKIAEKMKSLVQYDLRIRRPHGIIHDGYYYLIIDEFGDGESSKFVLAYDIIKDAWIEMDSPNINTANISNRIRGIMCGGNEGRIYRYPGAFSYDQTTEGDIPIPFEYRSPEIDAGTRHEDKKYRKLWYNADIMDGKNLSPQAVDIHSSINYENGVESRTLSPSGADIVSMPLSKRALRAVVSLQGESLLKVRLRNIVLAWRSRKDR